MKTGSGNKVKEQQPLDLVLGWGELLRQEAKWKLEVVPHLEEVQELAPEPLDC